jgi:hypothetical protein
MATSSSESGDVVALTSPFYKMVQSIISLIYHEYLTLKEYIRWSECSSQLQRCSR